MEHNLWFFNRYISSPKNIRCVQRIWARSALLTSSVESVKSLYTGLCKRWYLSRNQYTVGLKICGRLSDWLSIRKFLALTKDILEWLVSFQLLHFGKLLTSCPRLWAKCLRGSARSLDHFTTAYGLPDSLEITHRRRSLLGSDLLVHAVLLSCSMVKFD